MAKKNKQKQHGDAAAAVKVMAGLLSRMFRRAARNGGVRARVGDGADERSISPIGVMARSCPGGSLAGKSPVPGIVSGFRHQPGKGQT
jgi:hypothetical protein